MVKQVNAIRYEGESSEVMETIVNDEEIEMTINNNFSRRFSISPNSLRNLQ